MGVLFVFSLVFLGLGLGFWLYANHRGFRLSDNDPRDDVFWLIVVMDTILGALGLVASVYGAFQ